MSDFIHTGWYAPTLTTTEDPLLKVYETDNGINWLLRFYVGNELIDTIDLERPRGAEVHADVKKLPVYGDDDTVIGTVEDVLSNAVEYINLPMYMIPWMNDMFGQTSEI